MWFCGYFLVHLNVQECWYFEGLFFIKVFIMG